MTGRRIITIESDPQTIDELCRYDQSQITYLSERAMHGLDIITTPKIEDDNTSTALGFVALIRRKHPSTGIPPEENPHDQILVGTSKPFAAFSSIDGPIREQPDGIYTLIAA
jgi:hypothetical protein